MLHHGFGGRLVIGDDGQGLQLGRRQLWRFSGFQGFGDIFCHVTGGDHLIALFQLQNPHTPALEGIGIGKGICRLLNFIGIHLEHIRKPLNVDPFSGGKEDGFHGSLQFFQFHLHHLLSLIFIQ